MPEYLAPGVYVEETSFRAKSIEGVGTSTTAFVGPTRKGPYRIDDNTHETPELLTSFGDFVRIYGGYSDLVLGGNPSTNYLAHAVSAFFTEGGSRLYVSRAININKTTPTDAASAKAAFAQVSDAAAAADQQIKFLARFPGKLGNGRILTREMPVPVSVETMKTAPEGSLLVTATGTGAGATRAYYVKIGSDWFQAPATAAPVPPAPAPAPAPAPVAGAASTPENVTTLASNSPQLVTLSVTAVDADGESMTFEGLGFDRSHRSWIGHVLAVTPANRSDYLQNPFAISIGDTVTALDLRTALLKPGDSGFVLSGGSDGSAPSSAQYKLALMEIESLEDVSIVAAPGSQAYVDAPAINLELIAHASKNRAYRIAVLDTPPKQIPGDVRVLRGKLDSTRAALYYPWVVVSNPNARPGRDDIPREIPLPPSGFVTGIYARNDVSRGVHKAPANEVVRSALRFEIDVNFAQQELLNPLGVNCLRLLSGRGYRVWGARLISSDPEWKYVSDRRYFNYLEASIDRGTQWAVFEPNGERLWANIRQTISDFLYNEWRNGALLGSTTEEAYFVRCDRSTMTQNDLDNGRLICLIGVAVIKPAEFVVFRIGQKTADASS